MSKNKNELLPFTKKVSQEFTETMHLQDLKGLEKYNQALDPMDNKYDWLNMATEELADAVKYFKAEQTRRDEVLKEVMNDLNIIQRSLEGNNKPLHYIIEGIKLRLMQLSHNIG